MWEMGGEKGREDRRLLGRQGHQSMVGDVPAGVRGREGPGCAAGFGRAMNYRRGV